LTGNYENSCLERGNSEGKLNDFVSPNFSASFPQGILSSSCITTFTTVYWKWWFRLSV